MRQATGTPAEGLDIHAGGAPCTPRPAPHAAPRDAVALAGTGADRPLPVRGTGAALFLGGVALYRRARPRTDG